MITEDYVSFEVAKLLKEKGFDEYCGHFYRVDGEHEYCYKAKLPRLTNNDIRNHDDWVNRVFACTCPTLQMAMKWLRKDHHIHILPQISDPSQVNPKYYIVIWTTGPKRESYILELFNSYEEAVEEGIKYCLENLI